MLIPKRIDIKYINPPRSKQHYKLHPLIHTLLDFTLAQDIVDHQGKTIGKENPHRPTRVVDGGKGVGPRKVQMLPFRLRKARGQTCLIPTTCTAGRQTASWSTFGQQLTQNTPVYP